MEWIWWIFIAAAAAVLPAYIASTKGKSFFLWWIYGTVLLPVAFVHAIIIGNFGGSKQCRYCRTMVGAHHANCPRCGYEFRDMTGGEGRL